MRPSRADEALFQRIKPDIAGDLLAKRLAVRVGIVGMRLPEQLVALRIIDNCEHLLAAAASAVGAIVDRAGHARVLVTSREPLGIDAEDVCRVSPSGDCRRRRIGRRDAFVDRARAARHDSRSATRTPPRR